MALSMFLTLLVLSACITQTESKLLLSAAPTVIEPDLTKSLVVNCSYYEPGSGNTVVSLIIKKEDGLNSSLIELAYINSYSFSLVHTFGHLNATCTGQINAAFGSYLSLQWDYPSSQESGIYICEANIMSKVGEVHFDTIQTVVGAKAPQLDQIVQRIQEIETNLRDIGNAVATLNKLQAIDKNNLTDLTSGRNTWLEAMFSSSPTFYSNSQYRTYYLSRFQPPDADNAEGSCTALNGYLAEVDTYSEYNFILDFLKPVLEKTEIHVLLSGTNQPFGTWNNRRNGTKLGYTENWASTDPDFENVNNTLCQTLHSRNSSPDIRMEKFTCNAAYFLCEVEKKYA